jgi:glutamyl-tRNA reductase
MTSPTFMVLGLSHKTAPVEVRERYAFDDEAAVATLKLLVERAGLREAVLLSTCNRTELYVVPRDGESAATLRAVAGELASSRDRPAFELSEHLYHFEGVDGVRHLFRVCASLDSMVLGEPQILGQAKEAWRIAADAGTVGPVLGRFFERAFKVAKEVRSTTGVGTGQVSVGSIAVDLARQVFGGLETCGVLLLGAGKMAETVAKTLAAAGASRVTVANRTVEKALRVADRYGWAGVALSDLPSLLAGADVVIASIGAPGHVVDRAMIRNVLVRRRFRPLFLVDIAVPRVIEPAVGEVEGAYAYDIDDFNGIIQEHLKRRAGDVRRADEVVGRELVAVERWFREREVRPLIADLRQRADDIAAHEVERAVKALGADGEAQREVLAAMASSILNKLLHDPMTRLRSSTADGRTDLQDAARELFGMDVPGAPAPSGDACERERRGEALACAREPGEPGERESEVSR